MRVLYVVQRYGLEVAGGAEAHCRHYATHLARRGHDVHVLSSSALSYVDWADHFEPGTTELEGITLHRLPVVAPRDPVRFDDAYTRAVFTRPPVPLHLQRSFIELQGPTLAGLGPWMDAHAASYDVVVFITYLYYPTWAGLPVASALVPTVMHPTAHDEPPLALPVFELTFRLPHALAFLTHEERALILDRFALDVPSEVVGVGIDPPPPDPDVTAFRRRFGVGDRPYLLFVGRVDPSKGSVELFDYFVAYKERNPGDLALVIVGDPVVPLPAHPDVIVTGFVDEQDKHAAMAGALALTQPSYFESFSMVLCEAWMQERPALVQGRCDVLAGQTRRAAGGLPYAGFSSFEASVDTLVAQPRLRAQMGRSGRRYVESNYTWDVVMDRYERLLERTVRWAGHRRADVTA